MRLNGKIPQDTLHPEESFFGTLARIDPDNVGDTSKGVVNQDLSKDTTHGICPRQGWAKLFGFEHIIGIEFKVSISILGLTIESGRGEGLALISIST